MYWITPPARLCSESSDSDEYVMLFCLPSSGFISCQLHLAFPRRAWGGKCAQQHFCCIWSYHQRRQSNTGQSMSPLSMVRWKRLKRCPVHTVFAWTQIGRYGKWRSFCIDTLVLLESASIHFGDLQSQTTWQAVGVFYCGRIKLTVVDAEDLGMIHLFGGQCDWRRPWWCWNLDYTCFYHIVDHFPF